MKLSKKLESEIEKIAVSARKEIDKKLGEFKKGLKADYVEVQIDGVAATYMSEEYFKEFQEENRDVKVNATKRGVYDDSPRNH